MSIKGDKAQLRKDVADHILVLLEQDDTTELGKCLIQKQIHKQPALMWTYDDKTLEVIKYKDDSSQWVELAPEHRAKYVQWRSYIQWRSAQGLLNKLPDLLTVTEDEYEDFCQRITTKYGKWVSKH